MKLLLPCSSLNSKQVDEAFELEYKAAESCKFDIYLFDYDEFIRSGEIKTNLPVKVNDIELLLFRGWMLKVSEYENLFEKLKELGYQFINEPHQYKHCHHSCEVLSLFSGYTPRYLYFPNISRELFDIVFTDEFLYEKLQEMRSDFTNEFFILKDAVKSEKHDKEIFKIPLSITNIELKSRIIKFIDTRGKLYNEGLAFKEFINLKQYQDNKINEWRIYVLEDEIVSCSQNTGLSKHKNIPQPNIADLLQHRNKIMSNFFTVDMAELENGSWTIIETGDAQVSGLSPQQNELKFYNKFYKTIKSLEFTP